MGSVETGWPRLGATQTGAGEVDFKVWAPAATTVAVRLADGQHPLTQLDGGEARPDPCSRSQPLGIRGPSEVVDASAFEWTDGGWSGLSLEELVIYELHVGAFSEGGTFDAAIDRLPALRELGVTAVEVMPIATFPGERNWGYDGVYAYAPHPAYGGPHGFARLVDAAHAAGLGVILDVVYNHIGPG